VQRRTTISEVKYSHESMQTFKTDHYILNGPQIFMTNIFPGYSGNEHV